jgi:hypothetical protein
MDSNNNNAFGKLFSAGGLCRYQASGQWEKAIEVANRKDRIHLRTTHYTYARHLESLGQYDKAIAQYELAKTHTQEVPRMMYNANKIKELEECVRFACFWWCAAGSWMIGGYAGVGMGLGVSSLGLSRMLLSIVAA